MALQSSHVIMTRIKYKPNKATTHTIVFQNWTNIEIISNQFFQSPHLPLV